MEVAGMIGGVQATEAGMETPLTGIAEMSTEEERGMASEEVEMKLEGEEEMIHEVGETGNVQSVALTILHRGQSVSGAESLVATVEDELILEAVGVVEVTLEDEEVVAVVAMTSEDGEVEAVVVKEEGVAADEVETVEVSDMIVVQGSRIGIVQDAGCRTLEIGQNVSAAASARTRSLRRKAPVPLTITGTKLPQCSPSMSKISSRSNKRARMRTWRKVSVLRLLRLSTTSLTT